MMTNTNRRPVPSDITIADVARVYSGRPGCGCGCRGKYSDKPAQKTRVLNAIRVGVDPIVHTGRFRVGEILVLETETRYYWAYLTPEASARLARKSSDEIASGGFASLVEGA